VWKVDRLGRSTLDALNIARDLDARGVHIVITTLGVDLKTPSGRLVFGLMAQIAEFERELIRERVTAGIAALERFPLGLNRDSHGRRNRGVFGKRFGFERVRWPDPIRRICASAW